MTGPRKIRMIVPDVKDKDGNVVTDGGLLFDGEDGRAKPHAVSRPTCAVAINGMPCELSDLRVGDDVLTDGQPFILIYATRN